MNGFLKILQYMNSAPTKPEQLLRRQASRHDEMRENRFADRFWGRTGKHLRTCDLGQRVAPTAQAFDSVCYTWRAGYEGTNGEACGLRLWRGQGMIRPCKIMDTSCPAR